MRTVSLVVLMLVAVFAVIGCGPSPSFTLEKNVTINEAPGGDGVQAEVAEGEDGTSVVTLPSGESKTETDGPVSNANNRARNIVHYETTSDTTSTVEMRQMLEDLIDAELDSQVNTGGGAGSQE